MSASAYGPIWATIVDDYLTGKTLKAMLVEAAYVFDRDHDFRNDITDEVTGTGYTSGGVDLTGVTVAYDTGTGRVKIDADDADFGILTATGIAGIVVYVDVGTSATDPVISYHSFTAQDPTSQPFTYAWSVDGVGYLP